MCVWVGGSERESQLNRCVGDVRGERRAHLASGLGFLGARLRLAGAFLGAGAGAAAGAAWVVWVVLVEEAIARVPDFAGECFESKASIENRREGLGYIMAKWYWQLTKCLKSVRQSWKVV